MANVKKCDCCGVIYNPEEIGHFTVIEIMTTFYRSSSPNFNMIKDCCPDCNKKIQGFVKSLGGAECQQQKEKGCV